MRISAIRNLAIVSWCLLGISVLAIARDRDEDHRKRQVQPKGMPGAKTYRSHPGYSPRHNLYDSRGDRSTPRSLPLRRSAPLVQQRHRDHDKYGRGHYYHPHYLGRPYRRYNDGFFLDGFFFFGGYWYESDRFCHFHHHVDHMYRRIHHCHFYTYPHQHNLWIWVP